MRGLRPNLSFFRDSRGLECGLLYETGHGIEAVESSPGTVASDYSGSINRVADVLPGIVRPSSTGARRISPEVTARWRRQPDWSV